ncbi:MAG: hypothetical protein ABSA07_01070 [Acidimicrobiales bacterium]
MEVGAPVTPSRDVCPRDMGQRFHCPRGMYDQPPQFTRKVIGQLWEVYVLLR